MRRPGRLITAIAATVLTATAAWTSVAVNSTAQAATTSGGVKFAYFTQWGIYANGFYPKNLDTSGMAGKLDYLLYAFENINPTTLSCFENDSPASQDENNASAGDNAGDSYADYGKSYGADISVDGVADTWNQPLVGNFNQLKKLKAKYPNLKILVSIGGWTYSKYFSDAAATDASRKTLVSSCIDMFIKGNLPVRNGFGGPGSGAGVFDGIDIDWEYPGAPGHTGNHYSTNDKANYTALMAEFRSQLDALGTGRKYLTAAVPAGQDKISKIETNRIGNYLDYANVMTYDMHGGFEPQGPTNFQDPLYGSPNDPSPVIAPGTGKYNIDSAIKAYINGDASYGIPGGFPAGKTTIGYPFYYRGWTGVPAGAGHGLYQSAAQPATGHAMSGNVPGVSFYKELTGFVDNPSYTYFDPTTKSSYFYDGTTFWSGDNQQSIQAKADYQHCNGLAGAMMYSLEALDAAGTLFNQVVNATNGATAGCSTTSPTASPSRTTSASPSVSASPSKSPSTSPSPTGGSCTAAAWNAATAYNGGQQVSYGGHTWTAKWWTQGDIPGNNSQNVWTDNGACGGTSPTPTGGTGACSGLSAWNAGTAYSGGQSVTYGGHKWTAKWWTQGDIPGNNSQAVWTDNGAC
ncbi:glycoside hydrolase [Dactylosporangium vinaceum]|uniref:chitinase n=1 Tax=Dactylosporangium vinaceum TaxID=53362 RepID=A0ABV5MAF9_9ACTN|nr:glycosyl hydrolase family 18 protein [Dactylosporangium vinaceum]UAB93025.1 glycoside hydrolase [Dactylosporangium vinaceum]